jgi:hypothetical protein
VKPVNQSDRIATLSFGVKLPSDATVCDGMIELHPTGMTVYGTIWADWTPGTYGNQVETSIHGPTVEGVRLAR